MPRLATDAIFSIVVAFAIFVICVGLVNTHSIKASSNKIAFEFSVCEKFLNNPKSNCTYQIKSSQYEHIEGILKFKSPYHSGAFWLGFSSVFWGDCPSFKFTEAHIKFSGIHESFPSYFDKNADLSPGALAREKDAQYMWPYLDGVKLWREVTTIFGRDLSCKELYRTVGPNGLAGHWVE